MATMQEDVGYWTAHMNAGTAVVFGPVADPKGAWGAGSELELRVRSSRRHGGRPWPAAGSSTVTTGECRRTAPTSCAGGRRA